MADRITKIASTVGRAYGSFIKARDEMLRKPQFVADYIQQTAWQGGMFDNTDQATMRAIRNSWVHSAIQMKALDLVMSKSDVYNNPSGLDGEGEQAPGHEFMKVLRRPNPYMGSGLMWQYTHWWMDLRGKAFWFLAPGVNGEIAEIWPIPANRMAMEPTDDNKGIKRWILKLSRWWYLDPKYVCYFRYANPFDFFDGMPPLISAMLTIDADLAMKTWNGAFFGQENVMPSAIISLGSGDPNRLIDPEDISVVKEELKSEYAAINRKTVVTNANNMSAAILGWSAKDMDFLKGMEWNRDEIDWCFGIPPGTHDKNSTEANAKVGKGIFKDNMWGLKCLYADEITNQILKPHYNEDLEFRFEDDRVIDRELQLREAALAKEAMSREEWAQKYFNIELQPGDVTMAEGVRNAVTEIKKQQFGNVKDEKKFEEKGKKPGSGVTMKGGQGSGNFDHAGRPGKVGGSADEDADIDSDNSTDDRSIQDNDQEDLSDVEKLIFDEEGNWAITGNQAFFSDQAEVTLYQDTKNNKDIARQIHIRHIEAKKRGGGKLAMESLISQADKNNITLTLDAIPMNPYGEGKKLSSEKLGQWYEQFGFIRDSKEQSYIRLPGNKSKKSIFNISNELDLFHRKAVNKFKEKSHCNNLKFVSDVLDEETVKAIQSDLEGVEQRSDIEEVFAHWKGEVE